MKRLFKVAQQLRTTSEVIKKMIDDGEISYELRGGIYYVDESEVKSKLVISEPLKLVELDKEMEFIIRATIKDFNNLKSSKSNSAIEFIGLATKVLKYGYISSMDTLEYFVNYYSKFFLYVYDKYPKEFLKFFDVNTPSDFYKLRESYSNNNALSISLEHFYIFNKLCNGNIKMVTLSSIRLEEIKNRHFA